MSKEEPVEVYYKFVADLPPGVYTIPGIGEVTPGAVYKLREIDAALLADDPNWKESSRQAYTAAQAKE